MMTRLDVVLSAMLLLGLSTAVEGQTDDGTVRRQPVVQRLRVSDDGRFFVRSDGSPFYWQGDTAWELFARLSRQDALEYLDDRSRRRFNVIQVAAISCFTGAGPNAYGDRCCDGTVDALRITPGSDPADDAQYDYWDHVEFVVDEAAARGMYVAITAVWQNQVSLQAGPKPVHAASAERFARFLGERFGRKPNVIWQVVGDAVEEKQTRPEWRQLWRAMARGLAVGAVGSEDYGRLLVSMHPAGPGVSSRHFADEPWLTFHTAQSGHNKDQAHPHALVAEARRTTPTKPVIDFEPPHDDLLRSDQAAGDRNDDVDARKSAYWAVFAGAVGHTYGHASLFQMWRPGIKGWDGVRLDWRHALSSPGGDDMRHLRALVESRPQGSRVPDQRLTTASASGGDQVQVTRGDGFAFIYVPTGRPLSIRLPALGAPRVTAWWFDPREGMARAIATFDVAGDREFVPPTSGRGHDWVLVLDDASRQFGRPGAPF